MENNNLIQMKKQKDFWRKKYRDLKKEMIEFLENCPKNMCPKSEIKLRELKKDLFKSINNLHNY